MDKTKKLVCRLKGGLGNQLFQYACAANMASQLQAELEFDASILLSGDAIGRKLEIDRFFPGKVKLANSVPVGCRITAENFVELRDEISAAYSAGTDTVLIDGYFQNEVFFQSIAVQVKTDLAAYRGQYLAGRGLSSGSGVSVGLHIRRSDYQHFGLCADGYYREAIRWFHRKYAGNVRFFVFTDEPLYTSDMLRQVASECNVVLVNTNDHVLDFFLMSTCDHFVISNSTYSWWAAYLGERSDTIVFAPANPWILGGEVDPVPARWSRVAGVVARDQWPSDVRDRLRWAYFSSAYVKYQAAALALNDNRVMLPDQQQLFPCLDDDVAVHPIEPHYLYHPAWAMRKLISFDVQELFDFGSTLNFAAMASSISRIVLHDFRPPQIHLPNLECRSADLLSLPYEDASLSAISCMHTIEHIGLGRYGDPLNPLGDRIAASELVRVLKPGGLMLFVVPVGRPRLQFNAHRIYSFEQVLDMLHPLELIEHSLIPDDAVQVGMLDGALPETINSQLHGCGCFVFRKKMDKHG